MPVRHTAPVSVMGSYTYLSLSDPSALDICELLPAAAQLLVHTGIIALPLGVVIVESEVPGRFLDKYPPLTDVGLKPDMVWPCM